LPAPSVEIFVLSIYPNKIFYFFKRLTLRIMAVFVNSAAPIRINVSRGDTLVAEAERYLHCRLLPNRR